MSYLPDISWRTLASSVLSHSPYRFKVTVSPLDINEPGARGVVDTDCWFIDYLGYPFKVESVTGNVLVVYDVNERGWASSYKGPVANRVGYVYKPKDGAFMLTQAQLRYLDPSAEDRVRGIENSVLWSHRGFSVEGKDSLGNAYAAVNVTELLFDESSLRIAELTGGWQGGKRIKVTAEVVANLSEMFELVPNAGDPYIRAKLPLLGDDEITAYATGSLTSMWESMPRATYTTLGGVIVGDGLNVDNGVISLGTDITDLDNYYTKAESNARYAEKSHSHPNHLPGTGLAGGAYDGTSEITWTLSTAVQTQLTALSDMFELVPNDGNPYIRAKLDVLGDGGITAYSTGSLGDIWSAMPVATVNSLGGIIVGSSLTITSEGVLNINGDTFNLTNYYTKSQTDTLLSAKFDKAGGSISGNVSIGGNLTVLGTEFIADVQTVQIADNLAVINYGETGSGVTAGFSGWEIDRGTATNYRFGFTESVGYFQVGKTGSLQTVATREDVPLANGFAKWNATAQRFDTELLYSKTDINNLLALKVNKAGDTMTGPLSVNASLTIENTIGLPIQYFNDKSTGDYSGLIRFQKDEVNVSAIIAYANGELGFRVNGGDLANEKIKIDTDGNLIVSGNILATGGITAYSTGSLGDIWGSMPVATATTLGGIKVGESLTINNGVLNVNGDTFNLTNYYTKTNIDAFFAGTTAKTGYNKSNWDAAYTDRLKWDGGSTGLDASTGRTSLGLGTAATHDAQTSLTDTTAGRLMEVGAFGLGGGSIILTGSEWDVTSMPNQFVRATNSSDSIFNRAGVGLHLRYATTYAAQLFMGVTSTLSIKARATSGSGVWGAVQELYHTGNLVNPVTGTGSAGRVAFWNSATGLTKHDDFLFDSGTLRFANGTGGRGVDISNAGIRFKVSEAGGWAMALTARDQSNSNLGNIVGGYGGENSFTYAYLGGGTTYNNAALYAHSNNSVSINKTSVTSGYMLDVNGSVLATGSLRTTSTVDIDGEYLHLHYNNTSVGIKHSRVMGRNYAGDARLTGMMISGSSADINDIRIGGGTSTGYASTMVSFWTAANSSTTTGTRRAYIDNTEFNMSGNIYATGNITAAGEVTAYTASDARLKTNITSLAHINALDIINALNPVTYTWNDRAVQLNGNKNTTSINYGLIAQELEGIVPDLIRPIYGDYKTYDDRGLMTLVIQAVKQLKAGWDDSKKEVNELKEELMRLKNKN